MQERRSADPLPHIPQIDCGPDFPIRSLAAAGAQAHAMLDLATEGMPARMLVAADWISRRWLEKSGSPYLAELDAIATSLGRPGAYFLNVNYEWGCTVGLRPAADGRSVQLVRVLDWRTHGLGRHVMAARISGLAGRWLGLTWPGFTGVLQAVAPQRFAAALNQAPMATPVGVMPLDWAVNRRRVWRMPHLTPAHLLRRTFEEARSFAEARTLLIDTPVSAPAIFSLVGLTPDERCVIERLERSAHLREGEAAASAANHWTCDWTGRPRGEQSERRAREMLTARADLDDPGFSWLTPPILNERTRLVMIADPAQGQCLARGYESGGPATQPLRLAL